MKAAGINIGCICMAAAIGSSIQGSSPQWSDERWNESVRHIPDELFRLTAELGGRISGEHGIGHKSKKYMSHVVSYVYIDMLRSIKKGLDHKRVLNPGKSGDHKWRYS